MQSNQELASSYRELVSESITSGSPNRINSLTANLKIDYQMESIIYARVSPSASHEIHRHSDRPDELERTALGHLQGQTIHWNQ